MKKQQLINIIESITGQQNGKEIIEAIRKASPTKKELLKKYPAYLKEYEGYGVLYTGSVWTYKKEAPQELIPYLKEVNQGSHTDVFLHVDDVLNLE